MQSQKKATENPLDVTAVKKTFDGKEAARKLKPTEREISLDVWFGVCFLGGVCVLGSQFEFSGSCLKWSHSC